MASWVRRAFKSTLAGAVHYSGVRSALAAYRRFTAGGRRVLIVSYHRVVEDFEGELRRSIPGLLISQGTFRRHLEDAYAAGYDFASLGDALEVLAGRRRARRDLMVVTFDDGYRDVYRHAFPVLRSLGVPATVYLATDFVGTDRRFNHDRLFHLVQQIHQRRLSPLFEALPPSAAGLIGPVLARRKTLSAALDDFIGEHPGTELTCVIDALEAQLDLGREALPPQGDVMGWDEVKAMAKGGVDFGAHTLGHTVLTLESPERVLAEVRGSKQRLERELGRPVLDFAYCNGWYSDEVIRVLVREGFRSAVTTEDLPNRVGADPFALKRKVMWENFSLGLDGAYSPVLTTCQLDDVFGILGMSRPVLGRRPHGAGAQGEEGARA